MSRVWWDSARTTSGHGVPSQYNPEFRKEWVERETRRQGIKSPELTNSNNELTAYRTSHGIFNRTVKVPQTETPPKRYERMHNDNALSLDRLRQFQAPPTELHLGSERPVQSPPPRPCSPNGYLPDEGRSSPSGMRSPNLNMHTSTEKGFQPGYTHHHHFGWMPPTPQLQPVGLMDPAPRKQHKSVGLATKYIDNIRSKAATISTRRP